MPERTLLHLGGPDGATAHVWRRGADGRIETLFEGDWPITDSTTLAALRRSPPWIVMPDDRGSLLWVDIPTRNREQAGRALPFALEEWALDDPSRLHATLGPQPQRVDERWQWPVLLVDRAWRGEWLERLADAGIHPAGLVHPLDLERPPSSAEQWRVVPAHADRDDTTLRLIRGPHAGFVLPDDGRPAEERIAEVIMHLPEAERPTRLTCDGLGAENAERLTGLLATATPDGGIAVESQPMPERPATWFAAIEKGGPISAADTASDRQDRGRRRAWGGVVALAVLLAIAWVGLRAVEGWQAARQANALEARIEVDFRAALPEARLVNPRVQIEQAVAGLGGNGTSAATPAFLPLVAAVGQAMQDSDAHLERLDFQNGRLQADWEGDDYERLQAAAERLRGDARVTVVDMNASVEQGRARMHIELGRPENGGAR